jgi:hypothetical protein
MTDDDNEDEDGDDRTFSLNISNDRNLLDTT